MSAAAPVQIRALATGYSLSLGKQLYLSIFRVQILIQSSRASSHPFLFMVSSARLLDASSVIGR